MNTSARNRRQIRWVTMGVILASILIYIFSVEPPHLQAADDFLQVIGPCDLVFPRDHGPHPGYRTEWWYYTGHLTDRNQRRFGFQLTFFRRQLAPNRTRETWPSPASPWRTDQIYLAHAAVTDISAGRHLQAEKMARPVLNMAGAINSDDTWTVHIDPWRATIAENRHEVEAATAAFSLKLKLTPTKPIVLHGEQGYSHKGNTPDRASCYYSFTRLEARGTLSIDEVSHEVLGTAWMDHEFSTAPLQSGIIGWDWFSLQLSDQTEIMFFLLRQKDGTLNPASSGTHVSPKGETRHLRAEEVRFTPIAHWSSPHTDARYPVQWKISIPGLSYELETKANVSDQEMRTPRSTKVSYWEGSIEVKGMKNGNPVTGMGYIEMTGYANPFDTEL